MELANRLMALLSVLPQRIEEAEKEVVSATNALKEAEDALAMKEATLIMEGRINGRNETERKAQLLALTTDERRAVTEAQERLSLAKLSYNRLVNEFKAARSIALVIAQLSEFQEAQEV
jgi:hypothetical protein